MNQLIHDTKVLKGKKIGEAIASAKSFLIFQYHGLTGKSMTAFRKSMHDSNSKVIIAKNSIFEHAIKNAGFSIQSVIAGPCAMIYTNGDEILPFKEIDNLIKDNPKVAFVFGFLEGKEVVANQLSSIASIPGREGLLSMLLSCLTANIRNLACGIKAVGEQKQ